MSWEVMFNTIRSRFKTQIADTLSLETGYDNQDFDPPNNANWCRLTIIPGDTDQVSIGAPASNRERTVGVMIAQLFVPLHVGDGVLLELADSVRAAFKRLTADAVVFQTPKISSKPARDRSWWRINVACPFYTDDIG